MTESLRSALKQLRLSGLLESLEVRLHEAAANNLWAPEPAFARVLKPGEKPRAYALTPLGSRPPRPCGRV